MYISGFQSLLYVNAYDYILMPLANEGTNLELETGRLLMHPDPFYISISEEE